MRADLVIVGGGLGACAAALAAARLGYRAILTEETRWVGGQLTNQAVPPDEHPWIERFGATASYRALRAGIRRYYRMHLPLSDTARRDDRLNPGNGWVSRLCHDPRVAVAVLEQMMAPYLLGGRLLVLDPATPIAAITDGDAITAVVLRAVESGAEFRLEAPYFIDSTPYGDLLELADVEHVVGAESRAQTGEPHAADQEDPRDQQAITVCFAMEHLPGEDHTIAQPEEYEHWHAYRPTGWPGPLLSWTTPRPETQEPLTRFLFDADDEHPWWRFRRILDCANFAEGFARSDVTVVNWPQNDYWCGPVVGVEPAEQARHIDAARQLSLVCCTGYRPRPRTRTAARATRDCDCVPTSSAARPMASHRPRTCANHGGFVPSSPFSSSTSLIHFGRMVRSLTPIRWGSAATASSTSGAGYLDLGCWPFQIPLGAMIPVRVENLLPGGKNLGVTHITNGAFRMHPVEWNVGETAGILTAFCLQHGVTPRRVRNRPALLEQFQRLLAGEGVELAWPSPTPL